MPLCSKIWGWLEMFYCLNLLKNYNFYNYLLGKDLISLSVAENGPTIKLQQNTL